MRMRMCQGNGNGGVLVYPNPTYAEGDGLAAGGRVVVLVCVVITGVDAESGLDVQANAVMPPWHLLRPDLRRVYRGHCLDQLRDLCPAGVGRLVEHAPVLFTRDVEHVCIDDETGRAVARPNPWAGAAGRLEPA